MEAEMLNRGENRGALVVLLRDVFVIGGYLGASGSPALFDHTFGWRILQKGAAYNAHFGCACYPPLFVFTSLAIWSSTPFNPKTFTRAGARLEPLVARYRRGKTVRLNFRCDAAFADPETMNSPKPTASPHSDPAGKTVTAAAKWRINLSRDLTKFRLSSAFGILPMMSGRRT
jgi:hypothetical protein